MHASSRSGLLARSVVSCLLALVAIAGVGGCSAGAGGRPPVDSPVYAFQPVDPDEYAADDEDADDSDAGDDAPDEAGE